MFLVDCRKKIIPTQNGIKRTEKIFFLPTLSLKLLSEPEGQYTPLLPQYSLADLQKAMGASDAEMAVLQQLGEASLHVSQLRLFRKLKNFFD